MRRCKERNGKRDARKEKGKGKLGEERMVVVGDCML